MCFLLHVASQLRQQDGTEYRPYSLTTMVMSALRGYNAHVHDKALAAGESLPQPLTLESDPLLKNNLQAAL